MLIKQLVACGISTTLDSTMEHTLVPDDNDIDQEDFLDMYVAETQVESASVDMALDEVDELQNVNNNTSKTPVERHSSNDSDNLADDQIDSPNPYYSSDKSKFPSHAPTEADITHTAAPSLKNSDSAVSRIEPSDSMQSPREENSDWKDNNAEEDMMVNETNKNLKEVTFVDAGNNGGGSSTSGASTSSMMIHAGSSGNTWYTSSQLEMITYMFFVIFTLANTDMNILQFCSKTSLLLQLIQWLDITTPINIPAASSGNTTQTMSTSGNSSGGGNASLTMIQLCTIYLKLHYLALRIIIAIDTTVPELIESSEYRGYISTVMKKTKKSIVALLKYFSINASTVSASCVGGTVSSGMATAGGNGGLGGANVGGGNPTSAYKAITHQRYLYVLDSISLSEIEDLVNDDKIAILKDNCIIS